MYGTWISVQRKQKDTGFSIPSLSVQFPYSSYRKNVTPSKMHDKNQKFQIFSLDPLQVSQDVAKNALKFKFRF